MKRKSLRVRLIVASTVSITVALVISGFGLSALFERHVERRAKAELVTFMHQIAASIAIDESGAVSLSHPLADPRFSKVFSGLYWQLQEEDGQPLLRSRSLWDQFLALPADALPRGGVHTHILPGPQDSTLIVQERHVVYSAPTAKRAIRIAVALDRREIAAASEAFAADMLPALALLAIVLVIAAWLQVSVGLRPLESVRRAVNAVRERRRRRLEGNFPEEVMPLVSEVNDLLDAQEGAIGRARTRAGDLAHGLKTPLTVLAGDARTLRDRGETEIADEIEDIARAMQRHIDRELTRTRIAHESGGERSKSDLGAVVAKLVAAMRRTPGGEALDWSLSLPEGIEIGVEPADLAEVAGNILDNAVKWARSRIWVAASREENGGVILSIGDDGDGVPDEMIAALGRRGTRLDEQAPGTGLGLAIASEILEAYDGTLELRGGAEGGLQVTARFPPAH